MFLLFHLILLSKCFQRIQLSKECDFACWISSLNISLENFNTTFLKYYTIDVTNILIYDLNVFTISATNYPDPKIVQDDLQVTASVTGKVTGNLTIQGPLVNDTAYFTGSMHEINMSLIIHFEKHSNDLIYSVNISKDTCSFQIGLDIDIHFSGTIIDWFVQAFKPFIISQLQEKIGPMICQMMQDEVSPEFTNVFKEANSIISPYLNGSSPLYIPIGSGMADMRKNILVDFLRFAVTNFTGINGPLNFNSLINRFTDGTGQFTLSKFVNYFHIPFPIQTSFYVDGLGALFNLSLTELNLSGLNTWSSFDFLTPLDDKTLDVQTQLDDLCINISFGINVSTNGTLITTGDTYLSETGDLDLHLTHNHMDLRLQVASPDGSGLNYTNTMCLDKDCLLSLFSSEGTGMTLIDFNTTVNTIDMIAASSDMEAEIRAFINAVMKFFVDNYRVVIPSFLNGFINEYGVSKINAIINSTLESADCQYQEDPPYMDFVTWTTLTAVGAVCAVALLIYILMSVSDCIREKKNVYNASPLYTYSYDDELNDIKAQDSANIGCFAAFFRTDEEAGLLMTRRLPLVVRLLMPILVLLNVALFVSSNTGLGASVFIKVFLGSEKEISLPSLCDFGLINSIVDMWNAKAYALSLLVAVMSCAWPYLKLFLMLVCWIFPATILSPSWRESILKILDALGKWSLIDSFVMILMLVAFHFEIDFPIIGEDVKEQLKVALYVYPAFGFLTLMMGTLMSLTLSHVMLAIDRYVDNTIDENADEVKEYKALFTFSPICFFKPFVVLVLVAVILMLCSGMYQYSFSFEFVGLAGWAFEQLGLPPKSEYSVLDLAMELTSAAEYPNSFTVRFTQVLYFLVVIAMPLIHMISLLCMWIIPMTRKAQIGLFKACEVMYAWACLDVFTVGIIAALLEISQLARFLVGDRCEMIDPIVKMFFSNEDLIKGHETCFDVITVLLSGCWMLFAAGILHNVATIIVNIIARKALEARSSAAQSLSLTSSLKSKSLLNSKLSSGF